MRRPSFMLVLAGVAVSGATNTTMNITWNAVSGASGYNVFRNGGQVNGSKVTGTSFTDSGLTAATTYSWAVAALDASNVQGATSASVSGTKPQLCDHASL